MSNDHEAMAVLSRPNPFVALFEEIEGIARAALRRSSYFELRGISCEFSGGVLTLRGHVPTYHLKQIAQASVVDVPGVVEVHNLIEVTPARASAGSDASWQERESLVLA